MRDVALGTRSRCKGLAHQGIRNPVGNHERITGGYLDPRRGRMDPGLPVFLARSIFRSVWHRLRTDDREAFRKRPALRWSIENATIRELR